MTSRDPDVPAVVETRLVHDTQRRATSLLAVDSEAPVGDPRAVAELRDFVVAFLDHHHRVEDRDLWPILTARAPHLTDALFALSGEHELLDAALEELRAVPIDGSAGPAQAVRDLVHAHLSHEEPLLFPALEANLSDDDWAAFSRRTVASSPAVGTHLLIELLHVVGTAREVELLLRHLPPEAQELVPTLRDQGRATLEALGAVAR
jgi:hemerythrin-like domain-containing protein